MERVLTSKEQCVLQKFSKHAPINVHTKQATFVSKDIIYNVVNPVVYKIPNTNTILVFGDIRKSLSMAEMQAWLEQHMNKKSTTCGDDCDHDHDAHGDVKELDTAPEVEEIDGEQISETEEPSVTEDSKIVDEDVKFIVEQTNASKEQVVEALQHSNYDVIAAMVHITKMSK